jgi:hypothetical protein
MTRTRTMASAFAAVCGACAIFAAFWLHAGLLEGAVLLADAAKTNWSGEQLEAVMQYAGPLSLILVGLSLALMFGSSRHAK